MSNCAVWKFTELSELTENGPIGSLRARLEVAKGPSSIGTISVQFNCEGTTLSGVDLELQGPGYRVSLVKKRFVSGILYICFPIQYLWMCVTIVIRMTEHNFIIPDNNGACF